MNTLRAGGEAADAPEAGVSPSATGEEQSSRAGATPATAPQSYDAIIDAYVGHSGHGKTLEVFVDGLMRTILRLRTAEVPETAILAGLAAATGACIEGALSLGKIDKRFAQALAREVAESAGLDDVKVRELCE